MLVYFPVRAAFFHLFSGRFFFLSLGLGVHFLSSSVVPDKNFTHREVETFVRPSTDPLTFAVLAIFHIFPLSILLPIH